MSKSTFQQKTKLMAKLFDSGCNTEKKLQQLDMESICLPCRASRESSWRRCRFKRR